jgi:hypothetical protein
VKLWEKARVEVKGREAGLVKTLANLQEKAVTITLRRVRTNKPYEKERTTRAGEFNNY